MGDTAVVLAAALPYVAGCVVDRVGNFVVDCCERIVNFSWLCSDWFANIFSLFLYLFLVGM